MESPIAKEYKTKTQSALLSSSVLLNHQSNKVQYPIPKPLASTLLLLLFFEPSTHYLQGLQLVISKMARILFAVLSTLLILNTISARSDWITLLRRALKGGVSFYLGNMDAISTDLMKNNDPKEDCVFYVNSYNSTREKNAAIAFAQMRNRQLTASGGRATANTLYDAFDLNLAFGDSGTLMREATAGGPTYLRSYFKVTSGAYARLCRGTVWLIVKKGTPIYQDAIWLTHEYPQLIRPGSGVTAIWEIDPAEIEAALALNNPNRDLHPTPYSQYHIFFFFFFMAALALFFSLRHHRTKIGPSLFLKGVDCHPAPSHLEASIPSLTTKRMPLASNRRLTSMHDTLM
jgi:hypothetical protein